MRKAIGQSSILARYPYPLTIQEVKLGLSVKAVT